jgi:hypothetical protein
MTKINHFKTVTFITILCALCINFAYAKKRKDDKPQGTTAAELAQLKARPLPQPSSLKIAVLPLLDNSGLTENTRIGTAAVWMLLQRQNFNLTPILSGFKVRDNDNEIEPGAPLRKEDAVRLGKKLGVNWVIYGEVQELRVSKKTGLIKSSKYADASLRLVIADVSSGNILFWQSRHERAGGNAAIWGHGNHGDLTLKREGAIKDASAILDPFFAAFPQHAVSEDKFDEGVLKDYIDQVWPNNKQDSKDEKKEKKKKKK